MECGKTKHMKPEGLREFDDSIGNCCYCEEKVFRSDDDWTYSSNMNSRTSIAHIECDRKYFEKVSQI